MTVRDYDMDTQRIKDQAQMEAVGEVIKRHRRSIGDQERKTRAAFINDGAKVGLGVNWISEKSLANIENGHNMPSLMTLYRIALVCQMDPSVLFAEVAHSIEHSERDASHSDTEDDWNGRPDEEWD